MWTDTRSSELAPQRLKALSNKQMWTHTRNCSPSFIWDNGQSLINQPTIAITIPCGQTLAPLRKCPNTSKLRHKIGLNSAFKDRPFRVHPSLLASPFYQ